MRFVKKSSKLRAQIHGRGLRQARRGGSLHPAQSRDRQIHHILPLYRQVTVIWNWVSKHSFAELGSLSVVPTTPVNVSHRKTRRSGASICSFLAINNKHPVPPRHTP